jgi:hypothetical protein
VAKKTQVTPAGAATRRGNSFHARDYLLPELLPELLPALPPAAPPGAVEPRFCVESVELVPAEPLELEPPEAEVPPVPAGRSQALRKPARASAVTMERVRFMGFASPFWPSAMQQTRRESSAAQHFPRGRAGERSIKVMYRAT